MKLTTMAWRVRRHVHPKAWAPSSLVVLVDPDLSCQPCYPRNPTAIPHVPWSSSRTWVSGLNVERVSPAT